MSQSLWCLYHQSTDRELEGLSLDEVKAITQALTVEQRQEWMVWCQGWAGWHSLSSVEEIKSRTPRDLGQHRPPSKGGLLPESTEATRLRQEIEPHLTTHKIDGSKGRSTAPREFENREDTIEMSIESESSEFSPRAFERFEKRFKVVIECNGQQFSTFSKDVSVGGVLLEEPLPDWVVGYSTVDLIHEKTEEVAELTFSVVESSNPGQRNRIQFLPLPDRKSEEQFQEWLRSA